MATVSQWTGREATALRLAKRATVRGFAEELGVAVRTVTDWGRHGAGITPRPDTQAILDTALARCSRQETERFHTEIDQSGVSPWTGSAAPQALDYEQWSDDLDRAALATARQSFLHAWSLIERWHTRSAAHVRMGEQGLYLTARGLVLQGDIRRDQGSLLGPASAERAYAKGLEIFSELDVPRRSAQVELSLAVVREMSGALQQSAHAYQQLSRDPRLGGRDRARARLWVGTALSKLQHNDAAVRVMTDAARRFEELEEPEDWSVAQQKLALAHRGAGRLDQALRLIDIARNSHADDSPMQQVRLRTAQAHILVSDRATCDSGLALLDTCEAIAVQYGLSHQQRAIATVRRAAA